MLAWQSAELASRPFLGAQSIPWGFFEACLLTFPACVGLLGVAVFGSVANARHYEDQVTILQHRALLAQLLRENGGLRGTAKGRDYQDASIELELASQMVEHTQPLRAFGFVATPQMAKIILSAMISGVVVLATFLANHLGELTRLASKASAVSAVAG